jgi:hypothetical protein
MFSVAAAGNPDRGSLHGTDDDALADDCTQPDFHAGAIANVVSLP